MILLRRYVSVSQRHKQRERTQVFLRLGMGEKEVSVSGSPMEVRKARRIG